MGTDETNQSELRMNKPIEGSISGQVSCADGPVRSAEVSLGEAVALTDNMGNFVLEHLTVGAGKLGVKSTSKLFKDLIQDVVIEENKRKNLFLAEAAGKIEEVITDEDGTPLAEPEVFGTFDPTKPVRAGNCPSWFTNY